MGRSIEHGRVGDGEKNRLEDAPTKIEVAKSPTEARTHVPAAFEPGTSAFDEATDALPAIGEAPRTAAEPSANKGRRFPAAPDTESTAPRLGEYVLVARFPSSAFCDVYLGYKPSHFNVVRRAVVKWVSATRADFERAREALLDEARAMSLLDHPCVVSVLDVADETHGTTLALEYVAGTDLRRVVRALHRRGARLAPPLAVFITIEVLRALAHAHAAHDPDGAPLNLVHRDVNPSNVLIAEDGDIKLSDFGTVLMSGRLQTQTARGMVKGKVRYLAPEYILDNIATQRVDLYSAGVMLFEMLTGKPCFSSDSPTSAMVKIVKEGLPYTDLSAAGVSSELISIIEKCTAREPNERPASARGMADRLEAWMRQHGGYVSANTLADHLYSASLYD